MYKSNKIYGSYNNINGWMIIGTVFGIGKLPFIPGTYCSILATVVSYFLNKQLSLFYIAILYIIIFAIGTLASYVIQKRTGLEDPRFIVIDEYVGQSVALILARDKILLYIIGFFLFRFFDVFKLFPIDRAEEVKYGFGVMMDDLIAGLYSLIVVIIIKWLFY